MEDLRATLDDLSLENFRLMNDWIKLNLELESKLREARWLLAKGRQSIGSGRFSAAQLDERDRSALAFVSLDQSKLVVDSKFNENPYQLNIPDDKSPELKALIQSLFGAMPSKTVAQGCQKKFVDCLDLIVELAGLKSRLDNIYKDYKDLESAKRREE